mgnify:FL=1
MPRIIPPVIISTPQEIKRDSQIKKLLVRIVKAVQLHGEKRKDSFVFDRIYENI